MELDGYRTFCPPLGFKTQTAHPVVSCYTDYTTPVAITMRFFPASKTGIKYVALSVSTHCNYRCAIDDVPKDNRISWQNVLMLNSVIVNI